jgi:vancomycin resistance protein VanW
MMNIKERKPVKRSKLRSILGRWYYIFRRYAAWYFGRKRYASTLTLKLKEHVVFAHSTPLLRKLKDVDMYLQYNKITNLKLAVAKLNGIVLKPGETFSYWRLIGKPTYRKGYLDGLVLYPDGSFKPGVGGGLCQLSNLIYWMTLHTPLTVTERYRHSHDVFPDVNRTQPFGTGATCSYNYLDLQIHNGTNSEYQLILYLTKDNLEGEWRCSEPCRYSYEVYEKEHSITPGLFGGYIRNNVICRRVYNLDDELIGDDYITENHAYMTYAPYLETGSDEFARQQFL